LVCLDSRTDTGALAEWAAAVHSRDVRLIGQLVHQGRQTTTKPVTTTAIRNRDHGEAWPARVVVKTLIRTGDHDLRTRVLLGGDDAPAARRESSAGALFRRRRRRR